MRSRISNCEFLVDCTLLCPLCRGTTNSHSTCERAFDNTAPPHRRTSLDSYRTVVSYTATSPINAIPARQFLNPTVKKTLRRTSKSPVGAGQGIRLHGSEEARDVVDGEGCCSEA
ncbi:hypothetical protein MRB53_040737 [Persea americana]|nr:hypothetical protein MRB53_040737 [Persea americana]